MPRGNDVEICGFLDAKLPGSRCMGQRVRKRSLAPWKVWRRHWCSVKKLGPGLGVEIHLDRDISNETTINRNNAIKLPFDSILCRTDSRTKQFAFEIYSASDKKPLLYLSGNSESETQKWMANIRELIRPRKYRWTIGSFNVSMVDNHHSRAAGFSGLYGDMIVSRSGVFLKDVHTGIFTETFDWNEMSQFHLSTTGRPEDVKRICIIHTTKLFRNGIGQLQIFCINAQKLIQSLVTQGRGPKNKNTITRPLSLSDGDLRLSTHKKNDNNDTDNNYIKIKNKISVNLISSGIDFLIKGRSGSEVKLLNNFTDDEINKKSGLMSSSYLRAIDNDYQPEPENNSFLFKSIDNFDKLSTDRKSRISIASGIYAEIIDDDNLKKSSWLNSNSYENSKNLFIYANKLPPPLPPRKRCGSNSTTKSGFSDDGLDSESYLQNNHNDKTEKMTIPIPTNYVDDSDYVPMSPRLKDFNFILQTHDETSQEDIYMVMQ